MAKCKECGGNNAKKLSVIEKMGTQSGVAKGSGVGMTGSGVGVGFTHTNLNTKSDLARESAFSSSTNISDMDGFVAKLGPWVAGIVAIIMWANGAILGGIVVGFVILFLGYFIDGFTESGQAASDKWHKEYTKEKETYAKTWMCLDCGYRWVGKK